MFKKMISRYIRINVTVLIFSDKKKFRMGNGGKMFHYVNYVIMLFLYCLDIIFLNIDIHIILLCFNNEVINNFLLSRISYICIVHVD